MDLHPSSHHLNFGVKPSVLLLLPSTILLTLNMLVLVFRRNVISTVCINRRVTCWVTLYLTYVQNCRFFNTVSVQYIHIIIIIIIIIGCSIAAAIVVLVVMVVVIVVITVAVVFIVFIGFSMALHQEFICLKSKNYCY